MVLTGAARPASALSADGPFNLLQAVRVAASPAAAGMGVLVCLNDRIASRAIRHQGPHERHGRLPGAGARLRRRRRGRRGSPLLGATVPAVRTSTSRTRGRSLASTSCYSYLGMSPRALAAAIEDGAAGIVVAATGNGSMAAVLKPHLLRAREKGIVVVRASRVGSGFVSSAPVDEEFGTIRPGRSTRKRRACC